MLSIALYLLTHAMLLSLHLSGGSFPRPLSAQEEKKYVERMLAGDIEARNVLVEHNLRLVAHIAKKYYTQSDEQDDLISIGTIGLIKGVSSYRPEKGTRLATYAAKCVENEILMYFRSRKKLQGEVSLNDSLDSDADGESLYLMDVVGVEDTMYLDIQDRDDCLRVRRLVHECLTEREEEVIISRYGLGGRMPRTQREVAKKLGIPFISSTTTFAFNRYSVKVMKQNGGQMLKMLLAMPKINRDLQRLRDRGYPIKNILDIIQNDDRTDTIVYTSPEFQPCADTFSDKYAFVGLTLEWVRTGMKDDPAALIERVSTLIHGDITKGLEACRIDK